MEPKSDFMDTDVDDPVVREIDVFLSPALHQNLFLLQYPLRPSWRPYNTSTYGDIRVKPNQKQLTLSMKLDITRHVVLLESLC
jgi:DNA-directed RNA polymerase-3 subunit RPC5